MKREQIMVQLTFYRDSRKTPPDLKGGRYRPHLVVKGRMEYLGVAFTDGGEALPGEECLGTAELVYEGVDYNGLVPGAAFWVMEGGKAVGEGVVVRWMK